MKNNNKRNLLLTSILLSSLPLTVAAEATDIQGSFEDSYFNLKSSDGNFEWKFDGRIMLDAKSVDEYTDEDGVTSRLISTNTDFRRARFAFKTRFYKKWAGEFDIDYKNNKTKIKDMWVSYDPIENATIRVGNHKPFFSMAEVTTSRWYPLMETSSITDFSAPGRRIGASVSYWQPRYFAGFSVFGEETSFNDDKDDLEDEHVADGFQDYMEDMTNAIADGDSLEDFVADEGTWEEVKEKLEEEAGEFATAQERTGYSGRFVYRPFLNEDVTKVVHLGVNIKKDAPFAVDMDEFKMKGEVHDIAFLYEKLYPKSKASKNLHVDQIDTYGLELAARWNKIYFQSEYINNQYSFKDYEDATYGDYDVSGYYAEMSYFILGSGRTYNLTDGEFTAVIPKNSTELEVIVRYDEFDANDSGAGYIDEGKPAGILGGKMKNLTLGVNWYLNPNVIVRANYTRVDTDQNAKISNADIDILSSRLEFLF